MSKRVLSQPDHLTTDGYGYPIEEGYMADTVDYQPLRRSFVPLENMADTTLVDFEENADGHLCFDGYDKLEPHEAKALDFLETLVCAYQHAVASDPNGLYSKAADTPFGPHRRKEIPSLANSPRSRHSLEEIRLSLGRPAKTHGAPERPCRIVGRVDLPRNTFRKPAKPSGVAILKMAPPNKRSQFAARR